MQTFTKEQALEEMKKGNKVQHIDWLNEDNGLGKYWYYKINNKGKIVNQDGDVIDDWREYADGPCWWQIYQEFDYQAYENIIAENKAMAEFLESWGYSQDQVSDIANGGNPKTEIELLREEVVEMEKQPMANANAIERFKQKIESLENANIPKKAMAAIESRAKRSAFEDIYSDIPYEIATDELWKMVMEGSDHLKNIEDLRISEKYECCNPDVIKEQLERLFYGYKMSAFEAINLVKNSIKPVQRNERALLFYEVNIQELSKDTITMLDGGADYVYTGLGSGSMIFNIDTLQGILDSYVEDMDCEGVDVESDSLYLEFNLLVKLVVLNGCKGLFLTNGGSCEKN